MSAKDNAKLTENTGGQLKYIQKFEPKVESIGLTIDFTILTFENNRKKCNHLEIFNSGPDKCMIGFDTTGELIDCVDLSTFSFVIYPGAPFSYISLDGEADAIAMRTLTGKTATLEIIVW